MGKFQDLTGQRFGRLTVIKRSETNKYNIEDAIKARKEAELKYFGEYRCLYND